MCCRSRCLSSSIQCLAMRCWCPATAHPCVFTPCCCSWSHMCLQLPVDLAKEQADQAAGSSKLLRVTLPDASEHAAHLFVCTLYTKRIARLFDSLSGSWLQELADMTHRLDCTDLLGEVDAAMQGKVGAVKQVGMAGTWLQPSNALAVLTWAEQRRLPGLQHAAAEYAVQNARELAMKPASRAETAVWQSA